MSSDAVLRSGASGRTTAVSRTVVPEGLTDPVEQARAELKAALAAIEEKANVPRRVGRATDRAVLRARLFARDNPGGAVASILLGASAVGTIVWAAVRAYAR